MRSRADRADLVCLRQSSDEFCETNAALLDGAGIFADGKGIDFHFLAIGDPGEWKRLRQTMPQDNGRWSTLAPIVDFCAQPSPSTLASSVRQLLDVVSRDNTYRLILPWPVSAILRRVHRGEPSDEVLSSIESGQLGDTSTWKSIETSSVVLGEYSWINDGASALFLQGFSHYVTNARTEWASNLWSRDGKQLCEKIEQRSRFAAAVCAWSMRIVEPFKLNIPSFDPQLLRWLLSVGALSEATLPSVLPAPEEAAPFLAVLGEHVSDQTLDVRCLAPATVHEGWVSLSLEWFLKAVKTHRSDAATAALAALVTGYDIPASLAAELQAVPRVAGADFAWARVQFVASQTDRPALREAIDILSQRSNIAAVHRKAVARRWRRSTSIASSHQVALALRLWDITPEDEHETRDAIIDLVRRHTISLPGAMANADTRRSCGLPLAEPTARIVERPTSDGIVTLSAIQLHNIRCIESMQFDPTPPKSPDRGQWTVLLGDNGVGKTSTLRAIALSILKPLWVPRTAQLDASRLVRSNTSASSCRLSLHIDAATHECGCDFSVDAGRDEAWNPIGDSSRPFVVAYGATRAWAEDDRGEVSTIHEPQAIHSLLYPNVRVVNPRAWVNTLGGQDGPVLSSIREALEGALRPAGVEEVRISTSEAFTFSGRAIGRDMPLSYLSDGYLSTIGWIVDVMVRWVAACKRQGRPLPHNFQREMTGVVLVDEIDQHLHPRWQRELIETIRTVFPRLTFVVTTHNPLTAIELQDGELFGLIRDEHNTVQIRLLPSMRGRRVDEVLTGPWFGLGSTLDDDTLALMEEHRTLLRDNEDEPRQREIEERLRDRMGRYAELSIERIALGVAQEIMDEPDASPHAALEKAWAGVMPRAC